jgi:hypothetical protein
VALAAGIVQGQFIRVQEGCGHVLKGLHPCHGFGQFPVNRVVLKIAVSMAHDVFFKLACFHRMAG